MAQPGGAQTPGGRLTTRVVSASDTAQAYALFLPPGYAEDRRWPVLLVLDPRGRALLALRLFQEAAARLGWVIISSYNTLSDGPPEPNVDAMNAMLAAGAALGAEPSRTYLAGFSGTARAALEFAVRLRGRVAGVIAVGGALGFALGGPETTFAADPTFAYFGSAGVRDFNYEEVRAMGERFRATRVPARVVWFDGSHRWPPADICAGALEWLELRAMMAALRPMDSTWVRARLARELEHAAELERVGRWDEAAVLADAIGRDYAGWPGASAAAARAAALRDNPVMARYEHERRRLAERDARQGAELMEVVAWARSRRDPPSVESLARRLHIAELRRTVERGDTLEAASARRLLARISVFLSFYLPRAALRDGAPERALRMFETALTVGPIEGEGCALLREALGAATPEQQARFAGECASPRPAPADVHFVAGMLAHHAQAVLMAGWALDATHGSGPDVRLAAERIIVAQRDEIAVFERWLRAHGESAGTHAMTTPGMRTPAQLAQLDGARGTDFDRLLLASMIQHHEGAVAMVEQLLGSHGAAQDPFVFQIAADVHADQIAEIARMRRLLATLLTGGPTR